jgi:cytochrome c553
MKHIITWGAALLFATTLSAQAGGDAEAGKAKSATCAACHGPDGNSPTPSFPKIAGQHMDYLERALLDYKSGARANPIMQGQVTNLTTQDVKDLSSYFSRQRGLEQKY